MTKEQEKYDRITLSHKSLQRVISSLTKVKHKHEFYGGIRLTSKHYEKIKTRLAEFIYMERKSR